MSKDAKGTVGTLNSLTVYRRYLHGELTTAEFQIAEGGYTVKSIDAAERVLQIATAHRV